MNASRASHDDFAPPRAADDRVTLFATSDKDGKALPDFDGSTWDPWAGRLLFTAELGSGGGVWQATLDFPPEVEDISGSLGRGGYEGIQNDSQGNLWILEDVSGAKGTVNNKARQPNSFLYRFVPESPTDLTHGKLQALQVISLISGQPIVFHPGQADQDILSADVGDLHTYGKVFPTKWITLHDTATDGNTPFDANALAKSKGATPFKRPENGQFRPGSHFREFFFDETGDTDLGSQAGSAFGGFGSILKLSQSWPGADTGKLTLFFLGDVVHTGLDNCAFWSENSVVFVEDAGDGLHSQRNALDSAWLFDVRADYSNPQEQPVRILAEGRDASATADSGILAIPNNGFQNDGDNEITGMHVSDGDPTVFGILGAKDPQVFTRGWRVFFTQQHGDNITWEILKNDRAPVASSRER
jgi:secreted PhoX family phosphatase